MIKYIILILIFLLLSCEQPTNSEEEISEKTIELKTEYNEYLASHPFNIINYTLYDKSDSAFYVFYWCTTVLEVEQFIDSSWNMYSVTACTLTGRVATWEVVSHIWKEQIYIWDKGLFRIKFPFSRDSTDYTINDNIQYIYSNDFEVN